MSSLERLALHKAAAPETVATRVKTMSQEAMLGPMPTRLSQLALFPASAVAPCSSHTTMVTKGIYYGKVERQPWKESQDPLASHKGTE